jgi:hypothetical protein
MEAMVKASQIYIIGVQNISKQFAASSKASLEAVAFTRSRITLADWGRSLWRFSLGYRRLWRLLLGYRWLRRFSLRGRRLRSSLRTLRAGNRFCLWDRSLSVERGIPARNKPRQQ